MGKPTKADKRKARQKAQKRQDALNNQTQTDRLSAALEALCVPLFSEYVDDGKGVDLVGRQIVARFGVIAWNLAVTGEAVPHDFSLQKVKLCREEQEIFRNEIVALVNRKRADYPAIRTTVRDCTVSLVNGVPRFKVRPGRTLTILPTPASVAPETPEPELPLTPERIREIRQSLALTQLKFAEKLGVSAAAVSAWERGKSTPKPEQQSKLREFAL